MTHLRHRRATFAVMHSGVGAWARDANSILLRADEVIFSVTMLREEQSLW
jgi:hypothetical protein